MHLQEYRILRDKRTGQDYSLSSRKERMTYKPMGAPSCFGDPTLWSPNAPECVGGMDPGYTHPQTYSHKRDRCSWYSQCASASAVARLNAQPTGIAAPVQPVQVTVPPPPAPAQSHPMIQQYGRGPVAQYPMQPMAQQYPQQYLPQAPMTMPQQLLPPWVAQFGPQLVPMTFQQPGAQMPAYLSVPEPVDPDEPWGWRLFREVLRSMFKSSGHTAASFFDHNPWRSYIPPPAPPALPAPGPARQ